MKGVVESGEQYRARRRNYARNNRIRYHRGHITWQVRQAIWRMPCAACGKVGDTVIDHIIPVSKGGTSDVGNLQPLCTMCNCRKRDRLITCQQINARRT
jgi:5-methylcytosine-specific restriction endonuclease McrA